MGYREDPDLEFLEQIKSEDLNALVHCLVYGKDNGERFMQMLTYNDLYKKYNPDHHQYWREIAAEIQTFGGNTWMNVFRRGKGVLYREVLTDVCKKIKVPFDKKSGTSEIEDKLFLKILTDAVKKMTPEELKNLGESLGKGDFESFTPEILVGVLQTLFLAGGFASYQLSLIIANAVVKSFLGAGISFAGNITLTRVLSAFAGPIGLVITGIWTALDIAGPAYRVTIPAVVLVAMLRRKKQGYAIAIIGSVATGKTTLLRYLQKGEFVQIDKGTCVKENYESFESPVWNCSVKDGCEWAGASEFLKKQKELCEGKDIVLFCYNPKEIFENGEKKNEFLQRLQGLDFEKVFFIATHSDFYEVNDMKDKMHKFFISPSMGKYTKAFRDNNSFYVNLTDETETMDMLKQIMNVVEENNHD
jgi:uncharacterized protein YaaW (UPF0174 family)